MTMLLGVVDSWRRRLLVVAMVVCLGASDDEGRFDLGSLTMPASEMPAVSATSQVEIYALSTLVEVSKTALSLPMDVEYYALGIRKDDDVSWSNAKTGEGVVVLHYAPLNSTAVAGLPTAASGTFVDATAAIRVSIDLDSNHWTRATLVARVSGEALGALASKLDGFVADHPTYLGVTVDGVVDTAASSQGFVHWCLEFLADIGTPIAPIVPPIVGRLDFVVPGGGDVTDATDADMRAYGTFLKDCADAYLDQGETDDEINIVRDRLSRDEVATILNECAAEHNNTVDDVPWVVMAADDRPKAIRNATAHYVLGTLVAEQPDRDRKSPNQGDVIDWLVFLGLVAAFGAGVRAFIRKTGLLRACGPNASTTAGRGAARADLYQRLRHHGELQLEPPRSPAPFDRQRSSPPPAVPDDLSPPFAIRGGGGGPSRLSDLESGFV